MFLYWPVILIGLTILILFMPAPILYHRSREWWAYSNVGTVKALRVQKTNDLRSLGCSSLGCIPSNSEIFSLETCIALRHTPWGYALLVCSQKVQG